MFQRIQGWMKDVKNEMKEFYVKVVRPSHRFKTVLVFMTSFIIFTTIAVLLGKKPKIKPNTGLNMHQFCKKYGYYLQDETVQTEDGYILTMHRIKCPRKQTDECSPKRPAILILHGLTGSSADFVAALDQSLAFQLANKGYDVWLGNNRGNSYSRKHVMMDADEDAYFWDFSFHEIGFYDLPAMIDHITHRTKQDNITFIGMSQSCSAYFAMASLKPEYNKKIKLANLMAPVTAFAPIKSIFIRIWAATNFIAERFLYYLGPRELFGDDNLETKLLRYFCLGPHKIANYFCIHQFLRHGIGLSDDINYDIFPFHLSVSPAGASIKQFQHLVQQKVSGKFAQYDYYYHGTNLDVYGEDHPPTYDLSSIDTPLAVYFGPADIFVSIEGLYQQLRGLPNVILRHRVTNSNFNHMDFIYSQDINALVYNKMFETIDKYHNKSDLK